MGAVEDAEVGVVPAALEQHHPHGQMGDVRDGGDDGAPGTEQRAAPAQHRRRVPQVLDHVDERDAVEARLARLVRAQKLLDAADHEAVEARARGLGLSRLLDPPDLVARPAKGGAERSRGASDVQDAEALTRAPEAHQLVRQGMGVVGDAEIDGRVVPALVAFHRSAPHPALPGG